MGLDDAIDKAGKQPPQQDPKQLEAQWRERDKLRLAELLSDVLRRLTPYNGERIHVVQPSATGEHVGLFAGSRRSTGNAAGSSRNSAAHP